MRSIPFIALTLLSAGCGSGEVECGAPADISGSWEYTGNRTSPTAATITGTLSLEADGTCGVVGSYAFTINDGGGPVTMDEGSVAGVFLDATHVDLTLSGAAELRHLGEVVADTVVGGWDSGGNTGGTFRAERTSP